MIPIAIQRLYNQQLVLPKYQNPADVVACFGAVQAQDYAGAKWAVAQRMQNARDREIEQAFNTGALLRVHIMRPTWHFVTPQDIRWMMDLTKERVKAAAAYTWRLQELDEAVFSRCNLALAQALQGGKQLTRPEIFSVLKQAGIAGNSLRYNHILHHAELDQVVCSGARQGKQFTYALFDDRVPQTRPMGREEALAELALRYFTSHGPAALQDFAWWSGLTVADARAGAEISGSRLKQAEIDGKKYWFAEPTRFAEPAPPSTAAAHSPSVYLLPNYDELTVGYADRSALYDERQFPQASQPFVQLGYVIVIDGQIMGAWKREIKKDAAILSLSPFRSLTAAEEQAVTAAAQRYGEFLGLPVQVAGL